MEENNVRIDIDPGHDVLLLRSNFQRECDESDFKSLSEENFISASSSTEINGDDGQDYNHDIGNDRDIDSSSPDTNGNGPIEDLTFDLGRQNQNHADNDNDRDSVIEITSITEEFQLTHMDNHSVLNPQDENILSFSDSQIQITQIDPHNLNLKMCPSTMNGHEFVPGLSVIQSQSQSPCQPVLELMEVENSLEISHPFSDSDIPNPVKLEPELELEAESEFSTTVFNCACCAKLATYPGITEFPVSLSNIPISTDLDIGVDSGYVLNQGQDEREEQSLQHSISTKNVTVIDALSLIFEYPAIFALKPYNCSYLARANSSIFCNPEFHLDISSGSRDSAPPQGIIYDNEYPLCQKCGACIHQLYLMYKEFSSLLESEGRIIKTINAKLAACHSNADNDNDSYNNLTCHKIANLVNETPQLQKKNSSKKQKKAVQQNVLTKKKRCGRKQFSRTNALLPDIRTRTDAGRSGSKKVQSKVVNLEADEVILNDANNGDSDFITKPHTNTKMKFPIGKKKRGPGKPKVNVNAKVKAKVKDIANQKKTKGKISSNPILKGSASSALPKKRIRKIPTVIENEGFLLDAINHNAQSFTTETGAIGLLKKSDAFGDDCEYDPTGIISEGELFSVHDADCEWPDFISRRVKSVPITQRNARRKPNPVFPREPQNRKSKIISESSVPPTRARSAKTKIRNSENASSTKNKNNVRDSQPKILLTSTKRIRNWKKESWIEKAQSDPSRTCDLCGKSFIFPAVMRRHKKIVHQGLKPYECFSCGKRFTQKVILNKHTCDFSKESGNRDFLQMTRESELRKFVCTVCGKRFKYPTHLNLHEMNHRDERPYPCSQCDKSFRRPDHLKYHVRIVHVEEKKFICTKCGQTFKSISSLRAHEKKHSSEQGHLCNICGKSIKSMYQMSRHQKTHQDELPFECPVCGKRFKMKDYLGQHLRRGKSCSKKLSPVAPAPNKAAITTMTMQSNSITLGAIHPAEADIINPGVSSIRESSSSSPPTINNIIIITTTDAPTAQRRHVDDHTYLHGIQEESVSEQGQNHHISSDIQFACFSNSTTTTASNGIGPIHDHDQDHDTDGENQSEVQSVCVVMDEQLLTSL